MVVLLLVQILCTNFIQKWNLPYGNVAPGGVILVHDTDHDEQVELIFRRWIAQSFGVYFAEFVPPDSWDIYESIYVDSVLVWGSGDFDNDGYADLVTYGDASSGGPPVPIISVYESPDSFSYPADEAWRDTVDIGTVQPICVYDIDKDGITEVLQTGGEVGTSYYIDFSIYESIGDNDYEVKYYFESPETPVSTVAFGDFDGDSLNEFVLGTIDGQYSIFESPGNDIYTPICVNVQLPTLNIIDCFSVSDADSDGKLEFVVKGYVFPSAEIHAFIFEAINDNNYQIIKTFTLPGGYYWGGYSDAGDVDGDNIPEIVLEARQNVFIIKAASNDSFYIYDSIPGNDNGSSIRVYDIDGNGLSEVIISGNDHTRIYEYQLGIDEFSSADLQHVQFEIYPNPFRDDLCIVFSDRGRRQSQIEIYDVSGRLLKQFCQPINTQQHRISWDGRDNYDHALPGGVYFIRLETIDYAETKKAVLLD
jgi:hypothetical protein